MPKPKRIPSVKILHECLAYNPKTGALIWKQRPIEHFNNADGWARWNGRYVGKVAGVSNPHNRQRGVRINEVRYTAHRIIFKMMTGKEPPTIDHKNGNQFDNRWKNLRAATPTEQNWNRPFDKRNTSGYRGILRIGKKWIARITVHRVQYSLGTFATPEEAAACYQAAVRERAGEFHREANLLSQSGNR